MEEILERLRNMRALYVHHSMHNKTQARKLFLDYYGRECLRLRREIERSG